MGRKRIFKDDAARQAAHRAGLKKKQILLKRQGDYSTPQDLFEEYGSHLSLHPRCLRHTRQRQVPALLHA